MACTTSHAVEAITSDLRDALAGTSGSPSASNRFVTEDDASISRVSAESRLSALTVLGRPAPFSFGALRARKLARLGIGHTGIKPPGLF